MCLFEGEKGASLLVGCGRQDVKAACLEAGWARFGEEDGGSPSQAQLGTIELLMGCKSVRIDSVRPVEKSPVLPKPII